MEADLRSGKITGELWSGALTGTYTGRPARNYVLVKKPGPLLPSSVPSVKPTNLSEAQVLLCKNPDETHLHASTGGTHAEGPAQAGSPHPCSPTAGQGPHGQSPTPTWGCW